MACFMVKIIAVDPQTAPGSPTNDHLVSDTGERILVEHLHLLLLLEITKSSRGKPAPRTLASCAFMCQPSGCADDRQAS
jgi:hypothetical protein